MYEGRQKKGSRGRVSSCNGVEGIPLWQLGRKGEIDGHTDASHRSDSLSLSGGSDEGRDGDEHVKEVHYHEILPGV